MTALRVLRVVCPCPFIIAMLADASSPQTSGFVPSAAGLGRSVGDPSYGDGRFRPPDPASQSPVPGRRAEQSIRDLGPLETTRLLQEQSGSQDVSPRTTQPKYVRQGEARDDSHCSAAAGELIFAPAARAARDAGRRICSAMAHWVYRLQQPRQPRQQEQ